MIDSRHVWAWVVAAALVGGCVAQEPGVSSDQLLLGHGELGSLTEDDWAEAEAGCDGRLERDVRFAIASIEFGLIAVVEADGDVVCVDTVAAVEEELAQAGRLEEARDLVLAFHASVGNNGPSLGGRMYGDPDPEPNRGFRRFSFHGDPDPEPNTRP